jgi:hypothetical protein
MKLTAIHSDASSLNKQHTLSKFFNYKIKNEDSVVEAYNEIKELARCLNEMGIKMDDTTVVTKIVSSLPNEKYHAFKKAWDSVPDASQTMPTLMGRLRKEELEAKEATNQHEAEAVHQRVTAFAANSKKSPNKGKLSIEERKKTSKVKNCNKFGHWWKECRAPKKQEGGKMKQTSENDGEKKHAFMIYTQQMQDKASTWISD